MEISVLVTSGNNHLRSVNDMATTLDLIDPILRRDNRAQSSSRIRGHGGASVEIRFALPLFFEYSIHSTCLANNPKLQLAPTPKT